MIKAKLRISDGEIADTVALQVCLSSGMEGNEALSIAVDIEVVVEGVLEGVVGACYVVSGKVVSKDLIHKLYNSAIGNLVVGDEAVNNCEYLNVFVKTVISTSGNGVSYEVGELSKGLLQSFLGLAKDSDGLD